MIRKAKIADVPQVHRLVGHYASKNLMLARSRQTIYENLRDFFVCEEGGGVVGCAALHILWEDLAEVKSLAVDDAFLGQRKGTELVQACLEEARALGLQRVFVLTYQTEFFEKQGFALIDKKELPHKIWKDCLDCPKFPDCDEQALVLDIPAPGNLGCGGGI